MLRLLNYLLLTFLFTACGLQYVAPPTPISQTDERRKVIEKHLQKEFEKDSSVYVSIAYAKTEMKKPVSYRELDSLYEVKYQNERKGVNDKELERNIQIQRQIALNDTNPVLFVETHLFGVKKDGNLAVYSSQFETTPDHTIRNVVIHDSYNIPSAKLEFYKRYLMDESILYSGYAPTDLEGELYDLYRAEESKRTGASRDSLLDHALDVFSLISRKRILKKVTLLEELTSQAVDKVEDGKKENPRFEAIEEDVVVQDGKNILLGYQVEYAFTKVKDGLNYTLNYKVYFDPLYRITSLEPF